MPISGYFKGHGERVMASMIAARHGNEKAATREFYATANKTGMKPKGMADVLAGHKRKGAFRKKKVAK